MLNYRKIEAGDDAQLAEIIRAIYLTDSAKGKGYGKELVRLAENWARAAGYCNLYL